MSLCVGGLDVKEVLKIYKTHFSREVSFVCKVVVCGYSVKYFEYNKLINIPLLL